MAMFLKPRERLMKYGAANLSTSELLAVILRHGTKKEDIFSITNRLTGQLGIYSKEFAKSFDDLQKTLTLGPVQTCQILATVELGRRLFSNEGKRLQTKEHIEEYAKEMIKQKKEIFRGIYVSAALEIIQDEIICIGSLDKNIVHPREVFAPAIQCSAYGVFLIHNHPSGHVQPSDDDIELTIHLNRAAELLQIKLLDHLIIGRQGIFSFQEERILN